MTLRAGSVVVVNFPYTHGGEAKRRPALVLGADGDFAKLEPYSYVVVAQITAAPARVAQTGLWDVVVEDWARAGLHRVSVVNTNRLFSVQAVNVLSVLGEASEGLVQRVRGLVTALLVPGTIIGRADES